MVLPTYYAEGIPKSLIEALATGLAIITTKNGGCIETIDKNGKLVMCSDSFAKFLGYTKEEAIGETPALLK